MGGVLDKMRMFDLVKRMGRAKLLGKVEEMDCGKIADEVVSMEVVDDLVEVGSLDRLQVSGKARFEESIRINFRVVLGYCPFCSCFRRLENMHTNFCDCVYLYSGH